jgi:hypothetical protein
VPVAVNVTDWAGRLTIAAVTTLLPAKVPVSKFTEARPVPSDGTVKVVVEELILPLPDDTVNLTRIFATGFPVDALRVSTTREFPTTVPTVAD